MISPLLEKAILYATRAHAGQIRKGTQTPYIVHPFTVSMILHEQGCDEDVVVSGLLHDTVEDTVVTLEDIESEFGRRIAKIVGFVTEPDKSLPWETRKTWMLDSIKNAPLEAKCVSCADKLHNLTTLMQTHEKVGDKVWDYFSRGYDLQKWYARAMVKSLFNGLEAVQQKPMFYELQRRVEEFYNH